MDRRTVKIIPLVCAAVICCSARPAAAQAPLPSFHSYIGVSGGQTTAKAQDSSVNLDLNVNAGSWKVFAGVGFYKFFGVEVSYADLGSFEDEVSGTKVSTDAKVYNLYLVGSIPLLRRLRLFGKAGLTRWDTDFSIGGLNSTASSGSDWTYGAGLQVDLLSRVALRFEYERFKASPDVLSTNSDTRLDLVSAGIAFKF
jgi:opacity protein-like surface antigen